MSHTPSSNSYSVLGLNELPWYAGLFIALVFAGGSICAVAMLLVPRLRRKIMDELVNCRISGDDKRNFKPSIKTTSLSKTSKSGSSSSKEKSGFENVAFKPDTPQQTSDMLDIEKKELTLDPNKLAQTPLDLAKSPVSPIKPPVAPKPAHLQLKRQQAQEQQLEEIDLGTNTDTKPKLSKDVESASGAFAGGAGSDGGIDHSGGRHGMIRGERLEIFRLFSSLQILTACFASFAHGTNDVSNAVAPLIPIWNIFSTGHEDITTETPIWILAFGGIGICTGLWAWGRAVMGTVGDGLTQLTPSKGFSIELGAAVSVLCATKLGLPISTTHCKVGSVVIVGLVASKFCSQDNLLGISEEEREAESSKQAVDWKLFGNIAITWIVTVPLAALASAITMVILRWLAL